MNSVHFPESWASWELDPSTRQSVHVWTKYEPFDVSVGTTSTALWTANRGVPSVNLVNNPSFETTVLTEFTESGSDIARSNTMTASGTYALSVDPANSAAGEGFYWTISSPGHPEGSSLIAQCEVRAGGTGGDMKIEIRKVVAGVESVIATSATQTISNSQWDRVTISAAMEVGLTEYRVYVISHTQHNVTFHVDKFMVEQRKDGQITDYVDGSLGNNYEWFGAAHASPSKRRPGIAVVRGIRITNGHGSNTINVSFDTVATAAGTASTGVLLKTAATWETQWPIDVQKNVNVIASGASTQVYGVVWGVHSG